MRPAGLTCGFVALALLAGAAEAQQGPTLSPAFVAERDAGRAAIEEAEQLINAGAMGPGSRACDLTIRAMEHYRTAAVISGALKPGAVWAMMSEENQRAAVEKTGVQMVRTYALRTHACRAR